MPKLLAKRPRKRRKYHCRKASTIPIASRSSDWVADVVLAGSVADALAAGSAEIGARRRGWEARLTRVGRDLGRWRGVCAWSSGAGAGPVSSLPVTAPPAPLASRAGMRTGLIP